MDLLFHPKKRRPGQPPPPPPKKEGLPPSASPEKPSEKPAERPARPPRPRPPNPDDDSDLRPPPPEGRFSEFRLMSSSLNGWKYDIMKFDSRKPVDPLLWELPIRLNRKDLRREADDAPAAAPQAVGPMLGPDGKPVIGVDGKIVMVDAEGRPIQGGGGGAGGDKGKEKAPPKKRFQKKTKQVFLVPEEVRKLRREERYPWVIEDATQKEMWLGRMEEVSKSETHAMFMPAPDNAFKFVPAHRWYKFQQKPKHHVPTLEEAESLMTKIQKNKDPERWLLRRRNGQAPSEATTALFKAGREGTPAGMPAGAGSGGRKLKVVDDGMAGLFGDDDDEDGEFRKRKLRRELGAEGDVDELDFEETFQDDEEKMEPEEADDEEAKELEERLKREYKNANKTREGYIDESDDEDDITLTRAGKNLQKTLQKLEKDGGYDDSDEENPYMSEQEEEEEEEPTPVHTGPAIIAPEPKASRTPSQPPSTPAPANGVKAPTGNQPPLQIKTESQTDALSRPTSPVTTSHGGHSIVAKRAMSPSMSKIKPSGPSRASSPLASASRATSPAAGSPASPTSPTPNGAPPAKPSAKRKATDDPSAKPKKRRAPGPPGGVELEDHMVIEWLRNTPGATTRDCIHHFTPYLTDEGKKMRFTALVKEVAQLSKGVLVLRPAYRGDGGGSASPAPVPASA